MASTMNYWYLIDPSTQRITKVFQIPTDSKTTQTPTDVFKTSVTLYKVGDTFNG